MASFIRCGGIWITKANTSLLLLILLLSIAFAAPIEKYEPSPLKILSAITPQTACVCVPDSINGDLSPASCYTYDGCIGDGGGPCDDGIDNDCDCKVDCHDTDCGLDCDACDGTCDDPNCAGLPLGPDGQQCSPGGEPVEFCSDDFDNDADNYVDDCDATCNGNADIQSSSSSPYEPTTEVCDDRDNDCDGSTDEDGVCNIACSSNSQCGTNGWIGSSSCSNDDVYQQYRSFTCNNPGQTSSSCSSSTNSQKRYECGVDSCRGWEYNYCKLDDVYHNRTCYDVGCSGGSCFNNTNNEEAKEQECGTTSSTPNYCYDNDVYKNTTTRYCSASSCYAPITRIKVEDCKYGCKSSESRCFQQCEDGKKDEDETDIDCGGRSCPICPVTILMIPINWKGSFSSYSLTASSTFDYISSVFPAGGERRGFTLAKANGSMDYGWNWEQGSNGFYYCDIEGIKGEDCDQGNGLKTVRKCADQFQRKTGKKYDFAIGIADYDLCPSISTRGWAHPDLEKVVIAEIDSPSTAAHELGHKFGLRDQYCDCSPVLYDQDTTNNRWASRCGPTVLPNPISILMDCQAGEDQGCCDLYGMFRDFYGVYDNACGECKGNKDRFDDDRTIMAVGKKNFDFNEYNHLKGKLDKNNQTKVQTLFSAEAPPPANNYSQAILDVYLLIYKNQTVALDEINLTTGDFPPVQHEQGDYVLRVKNKNNSTLFQRNYSISYIMLSDPPAEINYSFLTEQIKYNLNFSKIEFSYGEDVLFSGDIPSFCNNNSVCDGSETYLSCSDCPAFSQDGFCNYAWDGGCDFDCPIGADPDCNTPPSLSPINNISARAGALVTIMANATDSDNVTLFYFINDSRFNHSSLTNSTFTWQTNDGDRENVTVSLIVGDGEFNESILFFVEIYPIHLDITILSPVSDTVYPTRSVNLALASNKKVEWCSFRLDGGELIGGFSVDRHSCYHETASAPQCGARAGAYGEGQGGFFFANYSKPPGMANGSLWSVKTSARFANYSVPNGCWGQERLQFRIQSLGGFNYLIGDCFNGSTWVTIFSEERTSASSCGATICSNDGIAAGIDGDWNSYIRKSEDCETFIKNYSLPCFETGLIYEEAMIWDVYSNETLLKNLSKGPHTLSVYCNDSQGSSWQSPDINFSSLAGTKEDLIVEGETITLCGRHSFRDVKVIGGGAIDVCPYNGTYGTGELSIYADSVLIDSKSEINGDGKGYRGAQGFSLANGEGLGGNGNTYGDNASSVVMMGSGGGVGLGSYGGGYGGNGNGGSRCAASFGVAGDGGAGISIFSNEYIKMEGRISSNAGVGYYGSGGSGGGILLYSQSINMSGNLFANGADSSVGCTGPGGGGRVKIFSNGGFLSGNISIKGGVGAPLIPDGGNGTRTVITSGIPPNIYSPTHPDRLLFYSNTDPLLMFDTNTKGSVAYYYLIDHDNSSVPTKSTGTSTFDTNISFYNLSDGTWYFHLVSENDQGDVGTIASHYQVNIDTSGPKIFSSTHPNQSRWYKTNSPSINWTTAHPESFPAFYYVLDQSPSTIPTSVNGNFTTFTNISFNDADDGSYFFHIAPVDTVGNVGKNGSHFSIRMDTSKPEAVSNINATSKPLGSVVLKWPKQIDLSGIGYYQVFRSTSSGVRGPQINNDTQTREPYYWDSGDNLNDGQDYFYTVYPVDMANNTQSQGNGQVKGVSNKSINAGSLRQYLISPLDSLNVARNAAFNFSAGAECMNGDCGDIEVSLHDLSESAIVFNETFPASSLNASRWSSFSGSPVINGNAVNEISSPFSLNVDGSNDGVTSIGMDISSFDNAALSFYYQLGGNGENPDNGDFLRLYYNKPGGQLISLWAKEGGGSYDIFYKVNISLPQDALHNNFSFQFNSIGSGPGFDDFFVEDIVLIATRDGGEVPFDEGIPLYINGKYPALCVDALLGEKCEISFGITANGNVGDTVRLEALFFSLFEINPFKTDSVNITIIQNASCNTSQTKLCASQKGVCKEKTESCLSGGFKGCKQTDYNSSGTYELIEKTHDGLDNDCNGVVDDISEGIADNDGDGVIDAWDACPNTTEQYVDKNGCTGIIAFSFKKGWNLVSSPSFFTIARLNESLASLNYSAIYFYNSSGWYSYIPGRAGALNTLHTIVPGGGYWIKSNENKTLVISK